MTESKFNRIKKEMNVGFAISTMAEKSKNEFLKYAKKEWADHRGSALTHIWKFFNGECSTGHEDIDAKLDILANEITAIKTSLPTKEEPTEEVEMRLDGKDHKL